MPLFFFDTDDGERLFEDVHGRDLGDADEARRQASNLVRDIAHDAVKADGRPRVISATVRDAAGVEIGRAAMILRVPSGAMN